MIVTVNNRRRIRGKRDAQDTCPSSVESLALDLLLRHFGVRHLCGNTYGRWAMSQRTGALGHRTIVAGEYNYGYKASCIGVPAIVKSLLGGERVKCDDDLRVRPVYFYSPSRDAETVTFIQIDIDYPNDPELFAVKEAMKGSLYDDYDRLWAGVIESNEARRQDIETLRRMGGIVFPGKSTGVNCIFYLKYPISVQEARDCVVRLRSVINGVIDCTNVGKAPDGDVARPTDFLSYPSLLPLPTEYPHRKQNQQSLPPWFEGVTSLEECNISFSRLMKSLPSVPYDVTQAGKGEAYVADDALEAMHVNRWVRLAILAHDEAKETPCYINDSKGGIYTPRLDPEQHGAALGIIKPGEFQRWLDLGLWQFATLEQVIESANGHEVANRVSRWQSYMQNATKRYKFKDHRIVAMMREDKARFECVVRRARYCLQESGAKVLISTLASAVIAIYACAYQRMMYGEQFYVTNGLLADICGVKNVKTAAKIYDMLIAGRVLKRLGTAVHDGRRVVVYEFDTWASRLFGATPCWCGAQEFHSWRQEHHKDREEAMWFEHRLATLRETGWHEELCDDFIMQGSDWRDEHHIIKHNELAINNHETQHRRRCNVEHLQQLVT